MPLPDERPRQSVANLIGRFEKPSAVPATFPRTSNVISHRTGDSAQEDVKEKREWPPKPADKPATTPTMIQPSGKESSPALLSPALDKETPVSLKSEEISTGVDNKSASPPATLPTPIRTTTQLPSQTMSAQASPPVLNQLKPSLARTIASVKSPVSKTVVKVTSEVPQPQSLGVLATSSSIPPAKSQHTGQATTSAHTTTRTAAKPRASAPPKTPATPARSRTPMSTRPKTPSSAPRINTPLSNARPKTPSGLYAPTAASLARSKAGPPAPPPLQKPKRKLTTDLSKPTAASASKMRSVPPVVTTKTGKPSPGKPAVKSAAKSTATKPSTPAKRPLATKLRFGEATKGDNHKAERSSVPPLGTGTAAADTIATATSVTTAEESDVPHEHDPDASIQDIGECLPEQEGSTIQEDSTAEEEHTEHYDMHDDEVENYDDDFPDDIPAEMTGKPNNNGHALLAVENPEEELTGNPDTTLHRQDILSASESSHDELEMAGEKSSPNFTESCDTIPHLHPTGDSVDRNIHEAAREDGEVSEAPRSGSDLEDIVNLLETGPQFHRPAESTGSAVSDAGEIPDEY